MIRKYTTIVLSFALVFAIVATGVFIYFSTRSYIYNEAEAYFKNEARGVHDDILGEAGLAGYLKSLEGLRGLFAASKSVERSEWSNFIQGSRSSNLFPATNGFMYIQRVKGKEKTAFIDSVRKDTSTNQKGFPSFTISPAGDREEYYVANYMEPQESINRYFGLDEFTNASTRAAIEKARDTGEFTTAPVFYEGGAPYLLIYLPIYSNEMPISTVDERRAAIMGLVSTEVNIKQLFDLVLTKYTKPSEDVSVGFYDTTQNTELTNKNLIYYFGKVDGNQKGIFEETTPFKFNGINWTLRIAEPSDRNITLFQRYIPPLAAIAIIFSGILLVGIYHTLRHSESRAKELAEDLAKKLSETEQRLVETAPDAIVTLDISGAFLSANEAAIAMFGYPFEDVKGRHFTKIGALSDTFNHKAMEEFANILGGQKGSAFELEIKQRSGNLLTIEANAAAIYENNKIVGVQLILRDITERKKTEMILKEYASNLEKAENRYHTLFEGANDAIFIMDGNVFIECNKMTLHMFGCEKMEDIIGHTPQEFSPTKQPNGEDSTTMAKALINAALAGHPQRFYWKHLRKDGTPFDAEVSLNRFEVAERPYLQALVQDITVQKRDEETLRNNYLELQKFKLAVESASDHIIITDPEGIVQYANRAAEKITGYTAEEILGQKAGKIWGGLMPKMFYKNMWDRIKNQKKLFIGEIRNKRKSGEEYVALVDISPILDEKGNVQFFVAIERDITKEKEIDRAKTEFVSLASHQLRTPLTTITWYAEMLLGGDAGAITEKQKQYIEEIHNGGRRLVSLVNALLSVSRIELGTFSIEPEPSDLVEICRITLKELEPLTIKRRVTLTTSFEKDIPLINADKNLVKIVFQNLIANAIEYTKENGLVHVELKKDGNEFLFSVSDNGIGIPKASQPKIFGKLFRADNAIETKTDGTGLGLYIVKSIMDNSGGTIRFTSKENEGTTFYVTIPLSGMEAREGSKRLTPST